MKVAVGLDGVLTLVPNPPKVRIHGDGRPGGGGTVDFSQDTLHVLRAGDTMLGALNMGAQTLYGDSVSGGSLNLGSTTDATKGKILFGTSAYDENRNALLLGTQTNMVASGSVRPALQVHGLGTGPSAFSFANWNNNTTNLPIIYLQKIASDAIGTNGLVSTGAPLGRIQWTGNDGSANLPAAYIQATTVGTPTTNVMGADLIFATNSNTTTTSEKMRLTANGYLGIGVTPTTSNGYLQLPASTTLATGGIAWGTDTNLYRSAANTLRTDDTFIAAGGATFLAASTVNGGNFNVVATGYNGVVTNIYSDTASAYSLFYRYKGTAASPTQVTSGSYLGNFGFRGANETGAINLQDGARFSALAEEDVTSTSQKTALIFYTANTGSIAPLERLRISGDGTLVVGDGGNFQLGITTGTKIGTANTQKISFWNKTPIVQPTTSITGAAFVAGTGTAVNDASTFGGYTLKQIAAALINVGLLT